MADLRGCRAARMSVVALKRTGLVASVKAAMDRTGMAQAVIPPVVLTPEAIVVAETPPAASPAPPRPRCISPRTNCTCGVWWR